jgi:hypothetical protein
LEACIFVVNQEQAFGAGFQEKVKIVDETK